MLAGHKQDIPESLGRQVPGLGLDLVEFERHPLDRVPARKPAVGAGIHTFIREVERREQAHRAAEMPPRQRSGLRRELSQPPLVQRLQKSLKRPHHTGFVKQGPVENF